MRINRYVALATGMSRRSADQAITDGRLLVNGTSVTAGQQIHPTDIVSLDNRTIKPAIRTTTIILNKPMGYVCSRDGQGNKTIYNLIPENLHHLKSVGRLDKDSTGLLLMTDDGELAHKLTHPSFKKQKIYELRLNKFLDNDAQFKIKNGIKLEDGLSTLNIRGKGNEWTVLMTEGRNRQIRRTFEALGYRVIQLHRTQFGSYKLGTLNPSDFKEI